MQAAWRLYSDLAGLPEQIYYLPLNLLRPGPSLLISSTKQGKRDRQALRDHGRFQSFFPSLGKPVMEFSDRILKCSDCGAEFVFTAGEQLFFHDKQFKNDPKHCKECKAKRVAEARRVRPETRTNCSQCGAADNGSLQAHAGPAGVVPLLLQTTYIAKRGHSRPEAVVPSRVRSHNTWKETQAFSAA